MSGPLTVTSGRIRLALRVQPGASRDDIGPISLDAEGSSFLKVRVTQPAEGGKAKRAVITLLAKTWRLPVTSMAVVAGHRDRRKMLEIAGGPEVAQQIQERLGALT